MVRIQWLLAIHALVFCQLAFAANYRKATEGREVVKSKIYPKAKTLEINGPNLGLILNQSYINTLIISGSVNYFTSETWGIGVEFALGNNSDKAERTCIENFYYDPEDEVASACGDPEAIRDADQNGNTFPRMGPAYVPVREIQNMLLANAIWTPVYGKQLIFLNSTSYFDLFVEMGMGIVNSTFYRKRDLLANGNVPRARFNVGDGSPESEELARQANDVIGAILDRDSSSYGLAGRPTAKSETNLMFNFGLGQKFHFSKKFHFKVFIRNQTLLGTSQGFDSLLSVMGGVGFRL